MTKQALVYRNVRILTELIRRCRTRSPGHSGAAVSKLGSREHLLSHGNPEAEEDSETPARKERMVLDV